MMNRHPNKDKPAVMLVTKNKISRSLEEYMPRQYGSPLVCRSVSLSPQSNAFL